VEAESFFEYEVSIFFSLLLLQVVFFAKHVIM